MRTKTPRNLAESTAQPMPCVAEYAAAELELAGIPAAREAALEAGDDAEVVRIEGRRQVLVRQVDRLRPHAAREVAAVLSDWHAELADRAEQAAISYAEVVTEVQARISAVKAERDRARQAAQDAKYAIDQARQAVGLMPLGTGIQGVDDAEIVEQYLTENPQVLLAVDGDAERVKEVVRFNVSTRDYFYGRGSFTLPSPR